MAVMEEDAYGLLFMGETPLGEENMNRMLAANAEVMKACLLGEW